MSFSDVGKKKIAVHAAILVVNMIVLACAARINIYQEFFFIADLFPFALSLITGFLLTLMLVLDLSLQNSFTGWPQFEIGSFGVLGLLWLCFNAFSTSRWRHVPMNCSIIPSTYPDVQQWCKEVNVLKAFIWIEFLMLFFTALTTLRYATTQHARGNDHIYKMPLSRYSPIIWSEHKETERRKTQHMQHARGDSEFFQNGVRGFQQLQG
ncbi:hypothetical protein C8J56DRAFT_918814 [Mycena floridula]|nr:hypothetical protein C8J56DRAFT_918814 [Mycena floridula]